ncbi:MAG: hypothetical protein ACYTGQ_12220 [Planctomycetota bacterium]|jgi:hypothetical protein
MNRTQLATYSLIASAFVLAGLIIFQASRQAENEAQAAMVFNGEVVTMLTALFDSDNEIVYTLDNRQNILTAHALDPNRGGSIILLGRIDIGEAFSKLAGDAGGRNTPTRRAR